MALRELLAALEQQAEGEVASLLSAAAASAQSLRADAAAIAARQQEAALAAERQRLAAEEATMVAAAVAAERAAELGARAELLARAAAAARAAATTAEGELPHAAAVRLLAAARDYLPAGELALRCPAARLPALRGAAVELGIAVAPAPPGEAPALCGGPWRVEVGLAELVERRWPLLATRLLRALEEE